jgi:DNA modification methylase
MLKSLEAQGALEGTGFDEEGVAQVLKDAAAELAKAEGLTDADDVPEVGDPGAVVVGDLYQLGNHLLLCGDSTKTWDVDRVTADAPPDMMWTDPPYGVSYVGKTAAAMSIKNDGADGLEELLRGSFGQAFRVLRPGAFIYIAHPPGGLSTTFYREVVDAGFTFKAGLVWVKDSMVLGHSDFHFMHEPIIYALKPARSGRRGRGGTGWYGDDSQVSVFNIPRPKRSDDHPTMKPVELVEAMLKNSSLPGHIVFEPFSGSGTTLMACERMDRKCRAIEIDPVFVNRTIARWEKFTGQKAVKVMS